MAFLARQLITSDELTMTLAWLGLGKLEVTHWPTKRYGCASPAMKSYFIDTCESLQARGVEMAPNNPVMTRVFLFFAHAILNPDDLRVRAAMNQHPHDLAADFLSDE